MKKLFNLGSRLLKGSADTALAGIPSTIVANLKSKDGGEGKTDWAKLTGNIITVIVFLTVLYFSKDTETAIDSAKEIGSISK
jgi:hypothetical protein